MLFTAIAIIALSTGSLAAPLSAASLATSWATNVVMTSGASQFAVWVPTDGSAHSTSGLTCLNVGASSTGSCDIANIDQVGVVDGYDCAFAGANGWAGSQEGTDNSGWLSVAPPQVISAIACVAESS